MDAFVQGFGMTFGIACGLLGVAMLIIGICYVFVYGIGLTGKKVKEVPTDVSAFKPSGIIVGIAQHEAKKGEIVSIRLAGKPTVIKDGPDAA